MGIESMGIKVQVAQVFEFSIIYITYTFSASMIWLRPMFAKISSQMAIFIDLKGPQ